MNFQKKNINFFTLFTPPSYVPTSVSGYSKYINSFIKYHGHRRQCLFCNGNFSSFLPRGSSSKIVRQKSIIGMGSRLSTCPRCHSVDRERAVYLYLVKEKPCIFSKNIRLLHVAPEVRLQSVFELNLNINYTTADLNSKKVDI